MLPEQTPGYLQGEDILGPALCCQFSRGIVTEL